MDRIKSQRQEWMSKSMQEVPEGTGTMDTKPNQSSPGKSIGICFSPRFQLNEVIKALFIMEMFYCINKINNEYSDGNIYVTKMFNDCFIVT